MRLVLALIALALGAILFWQWQDWPPGPSRIGLEGPPPATEPTDRPEPNPLARLAPLEPKETYAAINERTLFRPGRRPPEPESESDSNATSEVAGSLEGTDLNAVVIVPGMRQAWVAAPAGGLRHLRLGDAYEGWTVKDITPDTLVLERQGIANTLVLRDFSKTAAAPGEAKPPQPSATPRKSQPPPGSLTPRGARRNAPPRPREAAPPTFP